MRNKKLVILCGILAATALAGCGSMADLAAAKRPDLDLGTTDPIEYCNLDAGNRLVVIVRNQGRADAPASTTRVTFTSVPTGNVVVDLPTPALSEGASLTLGPVDVPANCYQADCHFTIATDSTNTIDESNERNNIARGYCLG